MQCPTDKTDLVMSERSGIEIDYCPKCRGVWLDRGELDKIIERSTGNVKVASDEQPRKEKERDSDDERQSGNKRKKEGFFGDLFDF